MNKKLTAFLGLIIFITSLFLMSKINGEEKNAQSRDVNKKVFAIVGEDTPLSCSWVVKTPDRVMNENTSQVILVTTSNSAEKQCETYLSLRAPGFEVEPNSDEQKISLKPGGSGSVSWIISPRKTGDYNIALSDIVNTQ